MKLNLEAGSPNEQIIKGYLENNASEVLAEKINKGTKTLKGCWNYITSEARKKAVNNCAVIEDREVFGWAIHYFEEDSINEDKKAAEVKKPDNKKELKSKVSVVSGQLNLFDFAGEDNEKH